MIDKYLVASCLSIIDDFNDQYESIGVRSEELKDVSVNYSEQDLVFKIGYFFGHRAVFERPAPEKGNKEDGKNNIVVETKDFKIEVKSLKVHKSNTGKTRSNKVMWGAIREDFTWLEREIEQGNKGKRAVIIGWFNATERFSEQMQLALPPEKGKKQFRINKQKIIYFPFIQSNAEKKDTRFISYIYKNDIEPYLVNIPQSNINCIFLGKKEDIFHLALYF